MTSHDSSAQLVARFLRANHYTETLEAFIKEAGLTQDAGALGPGAWTIEQILQEKVQFDASIKFERYGAGVKQGWTTPAPSLANEPHMEIKSNVLCVSGDVQANKVSVTTADRGWGRFDAQHPYVSDTDALRMGDSPVLSIVCVPGNLMLATSMSGHLSLRTKDTMSLVDRCRHHSKYAVQVVSYLNGVEWYIATAGWDQKVHVYAPKVIDAGTLSSPMEDSDSPSLPGHLGGPIHTITFTSNPESLVFAQHPNTQDVYLITSRRDSTHLYYYMFERASSGKILVHESGRQNLAPHSNAWVAFTPCSLSPCPTDLSLMAVATSHLPHMKLIIFRLLFPKSKDQTPEPQSVAALARTELALQDREDAAISINVTTMAPQTPYSTPQVVWRPDGSGLFVNGDDGAIRGIEATTGKVVCLLKGHEAMSKVRTLWAGLMNGSGGGEDGQEILVSGGFDKKLFVWTTANVD